MGWLARGDGWVDVTWLGGKGRGWVNGPWLDGKGHGWVDGPWLGGRGMVGWKEHDWLGKDMVGWKGHGWVGAFWTMTWTWSTTIQHLQSITKSEKVIRSPKSSSRGWPQVSPPGAGSPAALRTPPAHLGCLETNQEV